MLGKQCGLENHGQKNEICCEEFFRRRWQVTPIFLHIDSSWVKIRLHVYFVFFILPLIGLK